jgi:hypothetical protein
LAGLSTKEIQNELALPGEPTGFKLVNVGGKEIETSIAGANKFGAGGMRQFRLMENNEPSIFSEESYPLSESELFPIITSEGTPTTYTRYPAATPTESTGTNPTESSPTESKPTESSPTETTPTESTPTETPVVTPETPTEIPIPL